MWKKGWKLNLQERMEVECFLYILQTKLKSFRHPTVPKFKSFCLKSEDSKIKEKIITRGVWIHMHPFFKPYFCIYGSKCQIYSTTVLPYQIMRENWNLKKLDFDDYVTQIAVNSNINHMLVKKNREKSKSL